jgi:hypothetical protein
MANEQIPDVESLLKKGDLEGAIQAGHEFAMRDPLRRTVKAYQDRGLLTLVVVFDAEWLHNPRFTEEETAQAIKDINEYGEGFGDLVGTDRTGVSTFVMNKFHEYMEEEYGPAADAREAAGE